MASGHYSQGRLIVNQNKPYQLFCARYNKPSSMVATSPNQRTVEFYLSSLWSWLPKGSKRILDALESCDLACFEWDERCDWFHIRCLEDDKGYIMNEYLKVQSEMEDELKEKDAMEDDGSLIPDAKNDLIGTLRSRVAVPDDSDEPEVADTTENANNRRHPQGLGCVKKTAQRQAPKENKAYQF